MYRLYPLHRLNQKNPLNPKYLKYPMNLHFHYFQMNQMYLHYH
jgi:hypothetical protein